MRQKTLSPDVRPSQTYEVVEPFIGPSLSKLPAAKPLSLVLTSSHCCELPGTGRQVKVTLARVAAHDAVG